MTPAERPQDQLPLSGQQALVTGGAGGIGLATARALSEAGAAVTITLRSAESEIRARKALSGLPVTMAHCDITDRSALAALLGRGFDIVINNAAQITPIGRMAELAPEEFAASLTTNLTAQFEAIRFALPAMLAKGRGTVVNISSGAAHHPLEGWSAYCTAKAGLAMLTQCLHHEYGSLGIRSFGLAPGVVDTGMQGLIRASGINPVSQLPRESLAPPEQPAKAITWLCTTAADPWIGQEITIRDPKFRQAVGLPESA